jgi:hypothetical protein
MGTNWQQVAYSNAYNAAKSGQPLDHAISNQPNYASATKAAYAAYSASRNRAAKPKNKSTPAPVVATPATVVAKKATPKVETPAPTLELPTLNLDDKASVVNQTDKLLRYDSLPMQQARIQAKESGTPSGQIHSSQQEGAAMRAMSDVASTLGGAEATAAAGEQVYNWQQKATQATTIYNQQYTERLAKMGYDEDRANLMATLNSNLSQSMLSATTALMNNTDLDLQQGAMDKLLDIINSAQDNNNAILEMGFSYS